MISALRGGNLALFQAQLAHLGNLRMGLVRKLMNENGGDSIALIARAIGLRRDEFAQIYLLARKLKTKHDGRRRRRSGPGARLLRPHGGRAGQRHHGRAGAANRRATPSPKATTRPRSAPKQFEALQNRGPADRARSDAGGHRHTGVYQSAPMSVAARPSGTAATANTGEAPGRRRQSPEIHLRAAKSPRNREQKRPSAELASPLKPA